MRRIQPAPSGLARHWFAACREGRLLLQRCRCCARFQFYPRTICAHCHSADPAWVQAEGVGSIASFTVVRRAVSPAYVAPYVIALVDLVEGPRMMTQIVACEPEDLSIGRAVRVRFEPWADESYMPVFTLQEFTLQDKPPGNPLANAPGGRSRAGAVSAGDMPAGEPAARG